MTAGMIERWLDKPQGAPDIVEYYAEVFPHLHQDFELLEGPWELGNGRALRYRMRDSDDVPLFLTTIVQTIGPLLCEMTLSRLAEEDPARDLLFREIGETFQLNPLPHLENCTRQEVLHLPQERPAEERGLSSPHLCISFDLPTGWQLKEEGDTLALDGDNTRIRIERSFAWGKDPDLWLNSRVHAFQKNGNRVLGFGKGETEGGDAYAILLQDLSQGHSSWKTESASRRLEVFLDGPQALLWTLEGNQYQIESKRPLLDELLRNFTFLSPDQWELRLPDSWIDCCLHGPWTVPDRGIYLRADEEDFSLIHLDAQNLPSPIGLRNNGEQIVAPLDAGFESIHRHKHTIADFMNHPSLNYACDGTNSDGKAVSVRAMWIETPENLYSLFIQCTNRSEANKLLEIIRNGIHLG